MSLFKQDQLYKLVNLGYNGNQAADLLDGNPTSPVAGYHLNNDSNNQSWYIQPGPNGTVTFRNGRATSSFAYVAQQFVGSEIRGDLTETYWRLIPQGPDNYSIATDNGQLVWVLPGGADRTPIVLGNYGGDNTRWRIIGA